ncbi:MAG: glycosyltransferase [Flavobacteriales bacterium]|nr:glycosyltransferase [Flavobacteriales bacterium]
MLKVAFVHDWLVVSGGAEKVTREILRCFDADVFSLIDFLDETDRADILHGKHARTSFIQHLPFARSYYRYYLPFFPAAIERLDLSAYDLIISASYAVAKGVRVRPGQVHVCYIHTPMRYAWLREEDYLKDHHMRGPRAWLIRKTLERIRAWDLRTTSGVDHFIANSANVQERVKRFYGRGSDVLLPPVDTERFMVFEGTRSNYLSASRLVPYKRVDRVIEAFRELPEQQLLVLGDGPDRERLAALAPPNVTFLGHVPQSELVAHIQHAKAVITAADEDLGLTPLEAHACGTPVIALRRGGYLETVVEGFNGIFFDACEPGSIAAAVRKFEERGVSGSPTQLRTGMEQYSATRFRERFVEIVERTIREHGR